MSIELQCILIIGGLIVSVFTGDLLDRKFGTRIFDFLEKKWGKRK